MRLIKAKDIKVGDNMICYLDYTTRTINSVIEIEPNSDHNKKIGVLFKDVTCMIWVNPETDFVLVSRPWPEGKDNVAQLDLLRPLTADALSLICRFNDTKQSEHCGEVIDQLNRLHDAIDKYLMGLPQLVRENVPARDLKVGDLILDSKDNKKRIKNIDRRGSYSYFDLGDKGEVYFEIDDDSMVTRFKEAR